MSLRFRRGRAIAPCCPRSSPTCSDLQPADVRVNTEMDTAKDAWSIASGNYASRFAPAVAGTAKLAAARLAARLARIAAEPVEHRCRRHRVRRRPCRLEAQSGQQGIVLPRCGAQPLVAGCAARRHRPDDPRDRFLDPAGTDRAGRRRPYQLLAVPRLHLRFLRRRDRPHHPANPDRPLRHHARLRDDPASRHGRRPDPRRLCAGRRRRALRRIRLCRRTAAS